MQWFLHIRTILPTIILDSLSYLILLLLVFYSYISLFVQTNDSDKSYQADYAGHFSSPRSNSRIGLLASHSFSILIAMVITYYFKPDWFYVGNDWNSWNEVKPEKDWEEIIFDCKGR